LSDTFIVRVTYLLTYLFTAERLAAPSKEALSYINTLRDVPLISVVWRRRSLVAPTSSAGTSTTCHHWCGPLLKATLRSPRSFSKQVTVVWISHAINGLSIDA